MYLKLHTIMTRFLAWIVFILLFLPLGVKPWIRVLFYDSLLFFFFWNGSGSNACAYRFNFLKFNLYHFYGHANFCLCTLQKFSTHQHLGLLYAPCFTTQVGLEFATTSSNMSRNINVNFYTLRGFAFKKENFLKFHGESNFHCLDR